MVDMGWTASENLVLVLEEGTMVVYNIFGDMLLTRIISRVSSITEAVALGSRGICTCSFVAGVCVCVCVFVCVRACVRACVHVFFRGSHRLSWLKLRPKKQVRTSHISVLLLR